MKLIHIITPTGNYQIDTIFAGVHGEVNASGQFEIAPELKAIHLFNLFNPKMLEDQGIDIMSNLAPINVNESDVPAFKATLMSSLRNRWLSAYEGLPMVGAFARAAVLQERTMVDAAVTSFLDGLNLPQKLVNVERKFENIVTRLTFDDEGGDDGYNDMTGAELGVSDVLNSNSGAWKFASAPFTGVALGQVSTGLKDMHYATGSLVGMLNVHGHDEQINGLLDALSQLPKGLRPAVENVGFAAIEWHQEPVHQTVHAETLILEGEREQPAAETPAP